MRKAMGFIGTVRELGEFLNRMEQAAAFRRDMTDGYFYGYCSRTTTVRKGGGFVDFEALDQEPAPVVILQSARLAG